MRQALNALRSIYERESNRDYDCRDNEEEYLDTHKRAKYIYENIYMKEVLNELLKHSHY